MRIGDRWNKVSNNKDIDTFGDHYFEVLPTTPWNYSLPASVVNKPEETFQVIQRVMCEFPWKPENTLIEIITKGIRIPS